MIWLTTFTAKSYPGYVLAEDMVGLTLELTAMYRITEKIKWLGTDSEIGQRRVQQVHLCRLPLSLSK